MIPLRFLDFSDSYCKWPFLSCLQSFNLFCQLINDHSSVLYLTPCPCNDLTKAINLDWFDCLLVIFGLKSDIFKWLQLGKDINKQETFIFFFVRFMIVYENCISYRQ